MKSNSIQFCSATIWYVVTRATFNDLAQVNAMKPNFTQLSSALQNVMTRVTFWQLLNSTQDLFPFLPEVSVAEKLNVW